MSTTSVTVIGAGPTGLAAALALIDRGCTVRILERNQATTGESRAVGINRRSLEHLGTVGAAVPILAEAAELKCARFFHNGNQLADFHIPQPKVGPPLLSALPQSRTEEILVDLLAKRGCAVEWESEVQDVVPTSEGATVTVTTRDEQSVTIRSDYVLGADGSRSVTRKALGIAFEGHTYDGEWSLFDAVLEWPLPEIQAQVRLTDPNSVLVMITLGDGRHRVIGNATDLEQQVAELMPVGEVSWRNRFTLAERRVSSYGRGRIWLAGDAAHVHSPVGGQGMNLGIDDAFDFAATLKSGGDFEAFEKRRLNAARKVMARADRGLRFVTSRNPAIRAVRNLVIRKVLGSPAITSRLARAFFGGSDS